jgi:Ring finger domain
MGFFFTLLALAQCVLTLHHNESIADASNPFEDCAVCLEPITTVQPNFFDCAHSQFHSSCILDSRVHPQVVLVSSCPLCRAPLTRELQLVSQFNGAYHRFVLHLIHGHMFDIFLSLIREFPPRDVHIVEYVNLLLEGPAETKDLIRHLHVRNWSLVYDEIDLFRIARSFNDTVIQNLLSMGPYSEAHRT